MSWTLFGPVAVPIFIVMMRLDRLGKQVEAVCKVLQLELARQDPEREQELLDQFKEEREQTKKDTRQFWVFWAFVLAGLGFCWVVWGQ